MRRVVVIDPGRRLPERAQGRRRRAWDRIAPSYLIDVILVPYCTEEQSGLDGLSVSPRVGDGPVSVQ